MDQIKQEILTGVEAARHLRLSNRTLDAWRTKGLGPRWLKIGGKVAYRRADLDAWLEGQERRHTHDTPSGEVK